MIISFANDSWLFLLIYLCAALPETVGFVGSRLGGARPLGGCAVFALGAELVFTFALGGTVTPALSPGEAAGGFLVAAALVAGPPINLAPAAATIFCIFFPSLLLNIIVGPLDLPAASCRI